MSNDSLGVHFTGQVWVDGEPLPVAAAKGTAAQRSSIRSQENVYFMRLTLEIPHL